MQALRDLEPLARHVAGSAHRNMSASADIEDVRQVARIAAWEAVQKFDGRGTLEGFAAQCMRARIIDWQRTEHPTGRSEGPAVAIVGDDALDDVAADTDPARDIERAQQFEERIKQVPKKHRAVVARILAGETSRAVAADMGVSESRVGQRVAETIAHLQVVKPRVSDNFDPAAVMIRTGSMPAPAKHVSRYRELLERLSATQSVVLHPTVAASLRSEFKRAKVPYMTDSKKHFGMVEIWREPSPEQRAARRKARAAL